MKKKHRDKIDKAALHREASREHVGSVRPTRFIPKKRRGTGSRRGKITDIEGVEDENFLHVTHAKDHIDTAPVLAQRDQSRSVGMPGYKPVKLGTTQHRAGESFRYTPEVLEHANLLLKTEGSKQVAAYLKQVREGRTMAFDNVTEAAVRAVQRQEEEKKEGTVHMGPVEIALRDAERRLAAVDAQFKALVEERNKQIEIIEKLREAYELVTGKRAPNRREMGISMPTYSSDVPATRTDGSIKPKGYWDREITEIMAKENRPIRSAELQKIIRGRNADVTEGAAYQAVLNAKKKGILVDMGAGELAHKDFGNPKEKAANG